MTERKSVAIYNPYLHTKGGGEKVCLALAESLKNDLGYEVTLVTSVPTDLDELAEYFKLDLFGMHQEVVKFDSLLFKIVEKLHLPGKLRNIFYDRKIMRSVRSGNFNMFINNCYQSNLPAPISNSVYMCMFPQRLSGSKDASLVKKTYLFIASKLSRLILHPSNSSPIDTYRKIISNSSYTKGYVKEYWGIDTDILYPICEDMLDKKVKKQKTILHVGRFFENVGESHHKRQDALLKTFSNMEQLHKDGWQLHFVGSVAEDVGGLKYILGLMKQARNLPVVFHFNAPFKELSQLYNEASIYWHATGLDSDPKKHPEKQEHFGISTVEAMSTGAIPVVINSAGQKETVTPGADGYLWNDLSELESFTKEAAKISTDLSQPMRKLAIKNSKQFSKASFRKQVAELFN